MADDISPDTGAGDPARMSFEGVPRPDPASALARGRLTEPTAEPDGPADTQPSWVIDLKLTDHPRRPGGFFRVLTRLERRFECTEDEATRIHTDLLEATTRRLAQLPPVDTTHDDKKPLILEWDEDGRYTSTASVGRVERYAIDVVLLTQSDARGLKVHARKEKWFAATEQATGRAFTDLVEAMLNLLPDNVAEFP